MEAPPPSPFPAGSLHSALWTLLCAALPEPLSEEALLQRLQADADFGSDKKLKTKARLLGAAASAPPRP